MSGWLAVTHTYLLYTTYPLSLLVSPSVGSKNLERGEPVCRPGSHLSQMHTTNYMPVIRQKTAALTAPPPLIPPLLSPGRGGGANIRAILPSRYLSNQPSWQSFQRQTLAIAITVYILPDTATMGNSVQRVSIPRHVTDSDSIHQFAPVSDCGAP